MNAMPGPLAGRTIVVTRPAAQAGVLADAIATAGGVSLCFPLLEILPVLDPAPLQACAAQLAEYALVVFISPNAVTHAAPALLCAGAWPALVTPAAVGPGTVQALAEVGIHGTVVPAAHYDSEHLLALPALQEAVVRGRRVAILRGDGGRELLAETLRARGASVDCIPCYRRLGPPQGFAPLLAAWQAGTLDALVVSSSEALSYLVQGLDQTGRDFLKATPVFVPHQRIATKASEAGLQQVVLTAPADAGLLAGLCAYNWPLS